MSVFSGLAGRLPRALPASRALPSRYRWVNAVLAAAVVGLGVGAYFTVNSSSTPATQASIRTAAVTRGVVLSSVSATGNIQAASQLSVDFRTSGTISAVHVKVGQHVKAGQILGRIDPTDAAAGGQRGRGKPEDGPGEPRADADRRDGRAARRRRALTMRQARAQITTANVGSRRRSSSRSRMTRPRSTGDRAGATQQVQHRSRHRADGGRPAEDRPRDERQPRRRRGCGHRRAGDRHQATRPSSARTA